MNADKVIYGNVVTMNEQQPRAQAMAIKDEKIVFVGVKDDVSLMLVINSKVNSIQATSVGIMTALMSLLQLYVRQMKMVFQ